MPLYAACDEHLKKSSRDFAEPECRIGIGVFAEARAAKALNGMDVRIGKILHPSSSQSRRETKASPKPQRSNLNALTISQRRLPET